MKRLTVAAVIGLFAFASLAFGSTKHYAGKDTDAQCGAAPTVTCDIRFNGIVKNHKVKKVKNFVYAGIPITCTEGTFVVNNTANPLPTMPVNKFRKFSGHFHTTDNSQFIDVTGKFSKTYKRATGTMRIHGDFPPVASGCDTGLDHYHVAR